MLKYSFSGFIRNNTGHWDAFEIKVETENLLTGHEQRRKLVVSALDKAGHIFDPEKDVKVFTHHQWPQSGEGS